MIQGNFVTRAALGLLLIAACCAVMLPAAAAQPRPIGRLPDAEAAVWHELARAGLSGRIAGVEVATNGRLVIAGIRFTYRLASVSDPAGRLRLRAIAIAATTLGGVPVLDQVHLSAYHLEEGAFDFRRRDVTFSAAYQRKDLPDLRAISRVWVHPALSEPTPEDRMKTLDVRRYPPEASRAGIESSALYAGKVIEGPEASQHAERSMRRRLPTRVIFRGNPAARVLALTFDDGPEPVYTTLLLDTLEHLGLRATCFLIGDRVEQYPYFARDIVAAGHEVGNHSFHHVNLPRQQPGDLERELGATQQVIQQVTGILPRYFRPPGGNFNRGVLRVASLHGLTTVFWTDNPADYTQAGTLILEAKLLRRVSNGGILLLHQGVEDTIRILPHATEMLRQRGFDLVTVSGLPR